MKKLKSNTLDIKIKDENAITAPTPTPTTVQQFHSDDDDDSDYLEFYQQMNHSLKCHSPRETVWNNPNMVKIEKVKAIVPCSLLFSLQKIERLTKGNNEFGLYLKGKINKDSTLIISREFFIPKQEVGPASVDFKEDGNMEWNGVVHKHPTGCHSFSGTDDGSINGNHMFSLLYENHQITKGEINLEFKTIKGRIRLPLDIEIQYPDINISEEEIREKIQERTFVNISVPSQYNPPPIWKNRDFFQRGNFPLSEGSSPPVIAHGNPRISDEVVRRFESTEGRGSNPMPSGSPEWDKVAQFFQRKDPDKVPNPTQISESVPTQPTDPQVSGVSSAESQEDLSEL